jgi:hypothetical protein
MNSKQQQSPEKMKTSLPSVQYSMDTCREKSEKVSVPTTFSLTLPDEGFRVSA